MKLRVSCHLQYETTGPVTLILSFRAGDSGRQRLLWEEAEVSPDLPLEPVVTEPEGNRFDRLRVREAGPLEIRYRAEVESGARFLDPDHLRQVAPEHLDARVVPFLFPSRYCQSDQLARLAWQKFGRLTDAYDQVVAVTQWIHENLEYVAGVSNANTSALDTITQGAGVCRDFAHVAITFCRALNIPARYLNAYAWRLEPPDFHACLEVYIGGCWLVFDPTRLAPLNGLARIGSGRDAADISVCTSFGFVQSVSQAVDCEMLDAGCQPLAAVDAATTAVCLDQGPGDAEEETILAPSGTAS